MAKDEIQRADSHVSTEKFGEDTYSILDELFEDDNEMFVYTDNKYLAAAAMLLLEDLNLKCTGDNTENKILSINLEEGYFKFIKKRKSISEKVSIELPHDWTDFVKNVKSYLRDNPITQKEEKEFVVNPVTKEKTPLDEAMDSYKDELQKLESENQISKEEVEKLFTEQKDRFLAEMNATTYGSKKDATITLKSGLYNTILELIEHNEWTDVITEEYETTPRIYINNYGDVNVDIKILTDLGFGHLIKNETIDIVDSEFMNNRSILVKYEGQE